FVVDDVVGHRQEAGNEVDIGVAARGEDLVAAAAGGQLLRIKATFGANRNDDGVLDLLGLHEPENFGAIVLRAVRPAQPATRDMPVTQVHTFNFGTVDEDFAPGARLRQALD